MESHIFLPDGTPRYYAQKTLPIEIQGSSQAIDRLISFRDQDPDCVSLALNVANWTMQNMQDPIGYFYHRRYSPLIVKNPNAALGTGYGALRARLTL